MVVLGGAPNRESDAGQASRDDTGAWAPLGVGAFRWMWIAALVSNIGTWMQEVAAGWMMTEISSSTLLVALVQAATMGPVFLLGLPAGALADIVDRRKLLIGAQLWNCAAASALAAFAAAGLVSPGGLLGLVALLAMGAAVHTPAFQAVIPQLVPTSMLRSAVTLNGVSINLARAIGPALAGALISLVGLWAVFAANALTFLVVLWVVWRWRPRPTSAPLPPEHLVRAVIVGIRYARHDRPLQHVLTRAVLFMSCASAGWALLPLVVRGELKGSAGDYGIAMAAVGAGAVSGAVMLPRLGSRLSADALAVLATVIFAAGMTAQALVREFWLLAPCLLGLGFAWLAMMATLNASAQTVLPDWVRARGLAVFMIVFSGAMAAGSAFWGLIAELTSVPTALLAASFAAIAGCLIAPMARLADGEMRHLGPAAEMPGHGPAEDPELDSGEVQVMVFYEINEHHVPEFLSAMREVRRWRLRTGAHAWAIYRDYESRGAWVESFVVSSWLEHLRQHERTTEEDWAGRATVERLHEGDDPPRVMHLVAPRHDGSNPPTGGAAMADGP